jgi:hypothetical protein
MCDEPVESPLKSKKICVDLSLRGIVLLANYNWPRLAKWVQKIKMPKKAPVALP